MTSIRPQGAQTWITQFNRCVTLGLRRPRPRVLAKTCVVTGCLHDSITVSLHVHWKYGISGVSRNLLYRVRN